MKKPMKPQTMFEKVWERHVVAQEPDSPAVLYIDQHLIHEVTSPQAFAGLRERGLKVRRPERTAATVDHVIPTLTGDSGRLTFADEISLRQIRQLEDNCREYNICLYGVDSDRQGIIHVIGPEMGLTQPGMTIVCGDSHTATHGAFGALAFGIGTSEVEHVLATQCLLQHKSRTFEVWLEGKLAQGVCAKDIILSLIAEIGTGGGTGSVIEYRGPAVAALDMEQRMTICNMTIEAGARAGMIAPDETTYQYLAGREFAPQGSGWDQAVVCWRQLPSDEGAVFDRRVSLDVSSLEPMITYGTNPGMGIPVTGRIPTPSEMETESQKEALIKALDYMGLQAGQPMLGLPIDAVFIGSCTNGRLSDLRQAASVLNNRKVASGVRVLVVPGSQEVKRQAEAEGLDDIFRSAGAEWREAGCSMCLSMNGDQLEPGQYAVSTSNRNFEGRQGKGGRTLLSSPLTAAAAAVNGKISDVRNFF
jgi:3-isopropylmalate/(R)-2-methylmalate dehydratase large subunit